MRRLNKKPWLLMLALYVSTLSCSEPTYAVVGPQDWTNILELPGTRIFAFTAAPDGTLFIAASDGIYRSNSGTIRKWTHIVNTTRVLTDLFAPSREVVFAIGRVSDSVYKWRNNDGIKEIETPPSDSALVSSDFERAAAFFAIWGRGEDDVYVVGELATILHFNGTEWRYEPNPLLIVADSVYPRTLRSSLWTVSGSENHVYAAGSQIIRKTKSGWNVLPRPVGEAAGGSLNASAIQDSAVLFGGDEVVGDREFPRLLRLKGNKWQVLSNELIGFRTGIFRGSTQPDGSALFWSYTGEIAEVNGPKVQVYRLPRFRELSGAVKIADSLCFAGTYNGSGTVGCIERWWSWT